MSRTRENRRRENLFGMLPRAGLLPTVVAALVVLSWTQSAAAQTPSPHAYVANKTSNNVSVIDTGTHIVVATVNVGTNPQNVAVTPDGTRAYVTNDGSNNVSVIDTVTKTVIATVPVGTHPYGVAITPNGTRAYVTNPGSQSVSVIDTATNTVAVTVPTGPPGSPTGLQPSGVAITPDGSRVYVATFGTGDVKVINTATNTVVATVILGGQPLNVAIGNTPNGVRAYVTDNGPSNKLSVIATATNTVTTLTLSNPANAVAITPNGTRVYVTHSNTSNVSIIATANNAVTTLAAGIQPSGVAFTPDSSLAYLTNNSNKVYVFETATSALVGAVNVGGSPIGVAIAPAPPGLPPPPGPGTAPRAYVTNRFTSNVSVIDTGTDTLVSNVRVGSTPFGVAVAPDGSRVYVTNQGSNNVSVIETTSNTVVATVAVGSGPAGVAITPDGSRVYVADPPSNDVKIIDTGTNTVVATVAMGLGSNPQSVAISPDGSRYYVCNSASNSVRVISTATNTTIANVTVGVLPLSVAVTPNGTRVYVANSNSGTVSVINTATNTVIATVSMGGFPRYVTASPDGSRVYVSNTGILASQIISTATNTVVVNITGLLSWGAAFTPDSSRVYVADGNDAVKVADMTTNAIVNTIALGGINPEGVAILTLPAVSIDDVSITKPNSGTMNAVFTVTMARVSAHTVTVDFATADGTALSGLDGDYQSNSGTLTFNPGETTKTITVLVNGSTLIEPDKTFFVNLSNPTNAAIADAQGLGTIISPSSSLSINDVSVDKPASGTTDATFTVTLSAAIAQTVTVDFTTANGTAQSGTDFESNSGTLSFAPGETSKQIVVHVLGGTPNASDKTFFVNLSNPTNATLADAQGAGTILAGAVQIVVNETIHVEDAPVVLPSAMIGVSENITVTDTPNVLPSAMIGVSENIAVTDIPVVVVQTSSNTPPVVTPPTDVTVAATQLDGARGNVSPALFSFLIGGSATDDTDPNPLRLAPQADFGSGLVNVDSQTVFPVGTTAVRFAFRDADGATGFASANVTVLPPIGTPTNPGSLVTVVLTDANGNSQLAQVTFTSVTQPGLTVATLIAAPPTLPSAVIPLTPFFDITTTAVYTSPVQVCLNGSAFASDDQLLHFENGVWVNITNTLYATQICGSISSLSPFVVVRPHYVFTGFFEPVDNPPITNVAKSGSTVSVKWQLKTASGALISDINSFTSLVAAPVACDTSSNDAIETELSVAGDTVPHFDGTQWVFNWKTTKGWTGCRLLQLNLADGTQHFAKFRFR